MTERRRCLTCDGCRWDERCETWPIAPDALTGDGTWIRTPDGWVREVPTSAATPPRAPRTAAGATGTPSDAPVGPQAPAVPGELSDTDLARLLLTSLRRLSRKDRP